MNFIQRFFKEDIPNVFNAGKWRVNLAQQKSRLGQLEKKKNAALVELGKAAWKNRVKDKGYNETYDKLEELDGSLGQVQEEIDSIQNDINQENEQLNLKVADFDTRLKETKGQRQEVNQKLTQMQTTQKSIEQRINQLQTTISQNTTNIQNMQNQISQLQMSDQDDKEDTIASLQSTIENVQTQINETMPKVDEAKAELETNRTEQSPVQSEMEGYDQLIKMLNEQKNSVVAEIQGKIKELQQNLVTVTGKKNELVNKTNDLMPELGRQVFQYRPDAEVLSSAYAKADSAQNEIKGVNDEINLTQARLASVNSKSLTKVAVVGVAIVAFFGCILLFTSVVVPTVSNILKPDPTRDIRFVQSWTLENCSTYGGATGSLDVSVWENRRKDEVANAVINIKLLGSKKVVLDSNLQDVVIEPGGFAVISTDLDSKGSRIEEVTRSVSSVRFHETTFISQKDVDVETYFEETRGSKNIAFGLEITNNSDFRLSPAEDAFALVVDNQNKVVDLLASDLYSRIDVDAFKKVQFISISEYGDISCLRNDYSDEKVTFWYFVPLKYSTDEDVIFTISGNVEYSP